MKITFLSQARTFKYLKTDDYLPASCNFSLRRAYVTRMHFQEGYVPTTIAT